MLSLGPLKLTGEGLKARALRGTSFTILKIGGGRFLALLSNLVLTRFLFPEAFGMMAIVQTVLLGLTMISDSGLEQSIMRSKRGDDPDFLNTAWTVQIVRGFLLWMVTCAVALPIANVYGEPMLALLLPVAGISAFVRGFRTTKVATEQRHMALGRLTVTELSVQFVNLVIVAFLAWWWRSVWALSIGGVISTFLTIMLQHYALPGINNRLRWNRNAFRELFGFGKFIFMSSTLGFVVNNADKLILGAYLSLAEFGVFNIGFMLATLPLMISKAVINAVIFPLYRMRPITESIANRHKVLRARRMVLAACLGIMVVMAFIGVPLIDLLYDPRYAMAGPVLVLMSFALVPLVVVESYRAVFLAAGDSKSLFLLTLFGAILQITLVYLGVTWFGIFGVILAPALTSLMLGPLRVYLLRPHQGWDPQADVGLHAIGFCLTGLGCWLYWDKISVLMA